MRRPHILASSLSLVAFVAGANGEISSAIPGGGVSLVGYSAATGEVWLDDWACTTNPRNTPSSEGMTSAHIVSQSGVFSESQNAILEGLFDRASANKVFKLNPRGFGDFSTFGNIATTRLAESSLLSDLEYDGSGASCDIAAVGLSYFPEPNLSEETSENGATLIYKAASGEIEIDAATATPWIGVYSPSGLLVNADDGRDIAARLHYDFDLAAGESSLGQVAQKGISKQALLDDLSVVVSNELAQPQYSGVSLSYIPVGDINEDEVVDVMDIDDFAADLRTGQPLPASADLNGDGNVTFDDRVFLVRNVLNTFLGDANLDGEFNSSDLSLVFQASEYFDEKVGNSVWATGDWNGDGEFTSGDLVAAFKENSYEAGPRPPLTVPEPVAFAPFVAFALLLTGYRRKPGR